MEERLKEFYDELEKYYDACDYEGMEDFLMRTLTEHTGACGACYYPLQVSVLTELGTMYKCTGEYERSKEYFRQALEKIRFGIGTKTLEYATAANNLAGAFRLTGQPDEAIRYFTEALQAYESLADAKESIQSNYYCMTVLNNLGLVYLEMREPARADDCFSRVLPSMIKLNEEQGGLEPELAVTCCNQAAARYFDEDLPGAQEKIDEALKWYEKAPENRRGHLGAVYNLQGDIFRREGKKEDAKDAYQQAMYWTKRFFGENPEYETALRKMEIL